MPYIITVKNQIDHEADLRGLTSSKTVDTPEEARDVLTVMHRDAPSGWPDLRPFRDSLPESGGTIGPLPDGTVIEVRKV